MTKTGFTCLFGGTFNPIHLGHLNPLLTLDKHINVNELVIIPCHIPPHKALPGIDSSHRLAMTKLAIDDCEFGFPVSVSDFEIQNDTPSYTANTLKHLVTESSNKSFAFIVGMDSLLNFTSWFKWKEILALCHLVVLKRPGYDFDEEQLDDELKPFINNKILVIDSEQVDVSSTQLRHTLNLLKAHKQSVAGQEVKDTLSLIPESVAEYIQKHDLY